MKLLDSFFDIKGLQNTFLSLAWGLASISVCAQNQPSKDWSLPRHQVSVMLGQGGQPGNYNHNLNSKNTVVGLAYDYHLSRHFYASFDYQYCFNTFEIVDLKRNSTKAPTAEFPLKVEVVRWQNTEGGMSEFKEPKLFELSNNDGFLRRNNFNTGIGYMRVTSRNILKIGVGYSYTFYTARYVSTRGSSAGNLHTLNIEEQREWLTNVQLSYDFYVNQNISLGLKANILITGDSPLMCCLRLGYAPVFKPKMKKNPRV